SLASCTAPARAATVARVARCWRACRGAMVRSPARPDEGNRPMATHETRIHLKSNTRKTVSALLNATRADAVDLARVAKQAHWNVKGPHFIAIHEMLDGFRATLDIHVDTVAERAVQLGGQAQGTAQTVAEKSTLKPYPTEISTTKDHLAALIERYG